MTENLYVVHSILQNYFVFLVTVHINILVVVQVIPEERGELAIINIFLVFVLAVMIGMAVSV